MPTFIRYNEALNVKINNINNIQADGRKKVCLEKQKDRQTQEVVEYKLSGYMNFNEF